MVLGASRSVAGTFGQRIWHQFLPALPRHSVLLATLLVPCQAQTDLATLPVPCQAQTDLATLSGSQMDGGISQEGCANGDLRCGGNTNCHIKEGGGMHAFVAQGGGDNGEKNQPAHSGLTSSPPKDERALLWVSHCSYYLPAKFFFLLLPPPARRSSSRRCT